MGRHRQFRHFVLTPSSGAVEQQCRVFDSLYQKTSTEKKVFE